MLIAELLARAISVASLGTRPVSEVVRDVAEDAGRAIGERVVSHLPTGASREQRIDALFEVLVGEGFEPRLLDSHIALANCPFHVLAGEFTELVCGMNQQVLDGLVRAIGDDFADSRLEPESGFCCVRICLRETT
jgi:predicted ArsR family transcriptional regulator